MHYAHFVRRFQRPDQLTAQTQGSPDLQGAVFADDVHEASAFEEFHHDEQVPVGRPTAFVDPDDAVVPLAERDGARRLTPEGAGRTPRPSRGRGDTT